MIDDALLANRSRLETHMEQLRVSLALPRNDTILVHNFFNENIRFCIIDIKRGKASNVD